MRFRLTACVISFFLVLFIFHVKGLLVRRDAFSSLNHNQKRINIISGQSNILNEEQNNKRNVKIKEKSNENPNENPNEKQMLRVLIRNDDYQGIYHKDPAVLCTQKAFLRDGISGEAECVGMSEVILPDKEDMLMIKPTDENGRLQIIDLKRAVVSPLYAGNLELSWKREHQGYLIVNELPLEVYLPSVVSSEMPESFPLEALKAQSVCARTYAANCRQIYHGSVFGADLDDSTDYQVYNNSAVYDKAETAVLETRDMILTARTAQEQGEPVALEYFSASCGAQMEDDFSDEKKLRMFIDQGRETDIEYGDPWYRWSADVETASVREQVQVQQLGDPGEIVSVEVLERRGDGRAERVLIEGTKQRISLEGEYLIRKIFAPQEAGIIRGDGKVCEYFGMLPSGWFYIESMQQGLIRLNGGGYGHGNGMSQNGARHLAEQGLDYKEILNCYYPDCVISEL